MTSGRAPQTLRCCTDTCLLYRHLPAVPTLACCTDTWLLYRHLPAVQTLACCTDTCLLYSAPQECRGAQVRGVERFQTSSLVSQLKQALDPARDLLSTVTNIFRRSQRTVIGKIQYKTHLSCLTLLAQVPKTVYYIQAQVM